MAKKKTKTSEVKQIDVMVFEPGQDGQLRTIDDTVDALRSIVGGPVMLSRLPNPGHPETPLPGLLITCNEDGLLKRLPENRWGFVGTFVLLHSDARKFASLDANDRKLIEMLVLHDFPLAGRQPYEFVEPPVRVLEPGIVAIRMPRNPDGTVRMPRNPDGTVRRRGKPTE